MIIKTISLPSYLFALMIVQPTFAGRLCPKGNQNASFYDPYDKRDKTAGGLRMADMSYFKPNGNGCAVPTPKFKQLKGHLLEVCVNGKNRKRPNKPNAQECIVCRVVDNGPGVKGVDLPPLLWDKFGYSRSEGRICVDIKDLGFPTAKKAPVAAEPTPAKKPKFPFLKKLGSKH